MGTFPDQLLAPKPEVLAELYHRSGNRCALPNCTDSIVDPSGNVIGHVCLIESAMPDEPRFNAASSDEERLGLSNLFLVCADHLSLVASKEHESAFPVDRMRKLKQDQESKYQGVGKALEQAFLNAKPNPVGRLNPLGTFAELERTIPRCRLVGEDAEERLRHIQAFTEALQRVPGDLRNFMLLAIKRGIAAGRFDRRIAVGLEDAIDSFRIGPSALNAIARRLRRHWVGDLEKLGGAYGDFYLCISSPSEHLDWFDIAEFCQASGHSLSRFVIDADFGLLNERR